MTESTRAPRPRKKKNRRARTAKTTARTRRPAKPKERGAESSSPDHADRQPHHFEVRVRGLRDPNATARVFAAEDPSAALRACIEADVSDLREPVFSWRGNLDAVAVDIDRPVDADPVTDHQISDVFPECLPQPLAAWTTHGGGLRAIFVACDGAPAIELAAAWALLAPLNQMRAWRMEAKCDSRHPLGERDGTTCGPVHWYVPSSHLVVPGDPHRSVATPDQIGRWLDERGLSYGRHAAEHCPWCGGQPSSGNPPVLIHERGVKCFRCDGFRTWDALVGELVKEGRPSLRESAWQRVHYPHQRHVLREMRPTLPEELLLPAWTMIMRTVHAEALREIRDAVVAKLRSKGKTPEREIQAQATAAVEKYLAALIGKRIDVVRSSGGLWLDERTLSPRQLSATRTLAEMPWSRISGTRKDAALASSPLVGFVAVQALNATEVVGPYVEAPPGSIFVRRARTADDPPPLDLGDGPPPTEAVQSAEAKLAEAYDGFPFGYFRGELSARFVAQRCIAEPAILVVTGPTGSGKTAGQHAAGAAVGAPAWEIALDDPVKTLRQIGLALGHGAGLLFVDEIGRVPRTYERLAAILRLNSHVPFEAKYRNEELAALTAPVSILGSTIPFSVLRSPELARRAVAWRLTGYEKNWRAYGDLSRARHHSELREPLDTITRDVWWRLWELGPEANWRKLCLDEFGGIPLSELDSDDAGGVGRDEAVRRLYHHYRTAPETEFTTGARWAGWLDASPGRPAAELLGDLVDFEADPHRSNAETAELARLNLAQILGFSTPNLQLLVRRRSGLWLVKFVELGVPKGSGRRRSDFPAAVDTPRSARDAHEENSNDFHDAHDTHDAHTENSSDAASTVSTGTPADAEDEESVGRASCASCVSDDFRCNGVASDGASERLPLDAVIVDFETRSLADLRKVGGRLYSAHQSTEVICLVCMLPDRSTLVWRPGEPLPVELLDAVGRGSPVVAHNLHFFDEHIWRKVGLPEPAVWIDSIYLARAAGLPAKLDDLAQGLYGVGKDKAGAAVLRKARTADKSGKLPRLSQADRAAIERYCLRDVELLARAWEDELWLYADLEPDVRAADVAINSRGFLFDAELARAVISIDRELVREALTELPVTLDVLRSRKKLLRWLASRGVAAADTQAKTLTALLATPNLPDDVRAVIAARTGNTRVTRAKLLTALRHQGEDGRIRDSLAYHAAHTGRWGGRGMQPQNLPRGIHGLDLDEAVDLALRGEIAGLRRLAVAAGPDTTVEDVLSSLIRPCIVAPGGKLLAVVDYAGIEARALQWLARDEEALGVFRRGEDAYRVMAAQLFGVAVSDVDAVQRALGKALVLGCGYQLGAKVFGVRAAAQGVDWTDLAVTPEQAVEAWRDANPRVAGRRTGDVYRGHVIRRGGLWRDLEDAVRRVITTDTEVDVGRCTFARVGSTVVCMLPSGRPLIYRDAKVEPVQTPWGEWKDGVTYAASTGRKTLYGGKLTENITQAVCRDLQAHALVELERAGFQVVLHVHDECVAEVGGEAELARVKVITETAPAWADGLPIRVEGAVVQRYRKV